MRFILPAATDKQRIAALESDAKRLRALVVDLAEALHQHARTDCAPDEAIPFMRRLVRRAKAVAK